MPGPYAGKVVVSGSAVACRLSFDEDRCAVTPDGGAPIAFDLGDVDRVEPGEWQLRLCLFDGSMIDLRHFGAAFDRMCEELIEAWRDRTVSCLLLEDLEEVGRYVCAAAVDDAPLAPAQVCLFRSNLAVLPLGDNPWQLRLADVDSVRFENDSYVVVLQCRGRHFAIGKLAQKTDELLGRLDHAMASLRERSAAALHDRFALLYPGQLARLVTAMPEGRSMPLTRLGAIHPGLPEAWLAQAVDPHLQPYFDALRARSGDGLLTGFKFVQAGEEAAEGEAEPAGDFFVWFFFPVAPGVIAWEPGTGTGHATYLFRVTSGADWQEAAEAITRGLALISFRREPVYLPDASLASQPRFHRYAIGARKLPDFRVLRSAFIGRAAHGPIDTWQASLKSLLAIRS